MPVIDCFEPILRYLVQFCFQKHRSGTWDPKGMFSAPSGGSNYLLSMHMFIHIYWQHYLVFIGIIKNSPSNIMSTHCGNAKKCLSLLKLLDVADVSSLNKTKNLQGRAEETFKSAIAFLLSSVMLNQVKCISGLSNLHLSKVFSVRYLFCGVSFLCLLCF